MYQSMRPQKYIETILLTVSVVAISFLIHPDDPLFIHADFPWLWFLPVALALRYGRMAGAIAFIIIILGMLRTFYTTMISWDSYQSWVLGGATLTLLCGEYNALWIRRQFSLDEKTQYLNTRIESLSRAYGVLRFSHDLLEESLIIRPYTLRQSFTRLRKIISTSSNIFDETTAAQCLGLIASYGNLEKAGLYLLKNKTFEVEPIAYVGTKENLSLNDALVKRCIKERDTKYISVNMLDSNELSHYLAVLPMQHANGEIFGLLTISEIPFLSMNEETFKVLRLFLAYIADEVSAAEKAQIVKTTYPDCPAMFASELYKLKHLYDLANVDSSVCAYYIDPIAKIDDIIYLLIQQKRTLDIIWQTKINDVTILLVLMPLSGRSMLTGYRHRIDKLMQKNHEITLGQLPLLFRYHEISDFKDPLKLIATLLETGHA